MAHPLVVQLRFTRLEWQRDIAGVVSEDATRHFGQMNCISWIVGHMAWHEQRSWLESAQGRIPFPVLNQQYAADARMRTPPLRDTLEMWQKVTQAAEPYLDGLTTSTLQSEMPLRGKVVAQTVGSLLHRITYQYWYHIGEVQAIRQILRQNILPEQVGDMDTEAPYRAE